MNPIEDGYKPYFVTYDEKECLLGYGSEPIHIKPKLFTGQKIKPVAKMILYIADNIKKIKNLDIPSKSGSAKYDLLPSETLKALLLQENPNDYIAGKDIRIWLKAI